MSLIDTSYFIGDILIPNTDKPQVQEDIEQAIDQYEKEILQNLLGYTLWKDFSAEQDAPVQTRWIDLINGVEFSFELHGNTIDTKWNGLVNDDKISFIAYYVYYKYLERNITKRTGIGNVKGKAENATVQNDVRKMVSAWQKFLELYGELPIKTYWEGDTFDKYSDTYKFTNDRPSAFNYLNANRETEYTGWLFDPFNRINEFGI